MTTTDPHQPVARPGPSTELVAVRRRRRVDAAADVMAAWHAGQAVIAFDPATDDTRVARLLSRARPSVLVHERPDGTARRLTRLAAPRRLPGEVAAVVATSGTTGVPSLVVVGRDALAASTRLGLDRLGASPDEAWALCLPLDHVAGLLVLQRAAASRRPVEVHEGFEVADLLAGDAVWWALVPTMLHRVVATGADLTGRRVLLGGARAEPSLLAAARDAGAEVVTSYGMTETCGGCVYDGRPLDGVEVEVVEGRVRVRGPVLADGRLREDGTLAPLADDRGWLATADRAELVDGRLRVLGRDDDVIVTGGVNVDSAAVATVLRDLPDVADAAVVGVPDPEWGERVEAFVVTDGDGEPAAWSAAVRASLGRAAVPKRFHRIAAIPRGGLEKPDLPALRRLAAVEESGPA